MTPDEFLFWLQGYLDGARMTDNEVQVIREKLEKVRKAYPNQHMAGMIDALKHQGECRPMPVPLQFWCGK